ncbi:hypothetical protein LEAN103870_04475 [Legionella anisa]|uniref:Uncharacterized protein n=1 Tax=Legionella anisa TaxID=28082 RepID=A0AAX0WYD0_9GAMM|nr:hypothetical protein [Legionella anisa]AWN72888.1 hypothetical protein DLD14_02995 [Legionella anisa]KTC70660.1 hypothetical protein Lani_2207 [Legionella anisa]MBN5934629.1 hypothetical protein [Legionella anisa]MCW8423697.1 hypothetical protein [Legionella anisa]MCW8447217.1 hypothetical protein [Legionella anisa]
MKINNGFFAIQADVDAARDAARDAAQDTARADHNDDAARINEADRDAEEGHEQARNGLGL